LYCQVWSAILQENPLTKLQVTGYQFLNWFRWFLLVCLDIHLILFLVNDTASSDTA
jgi:hypothetical protein